VKPSQWEFIKKCAKMEEVEEVPVGLIVDSPWIPGYLGMSTLEFFTIPEKWFEANVKISNEFPDVIFLPGFWVEYGMGTEPSGFGCKVSFYENTTPNVNHMISSMEEVEKLSIPNPKNDGLMPLALSMYRYIEPKVKDIGHSIKVVAARGPLTIASHIMGMTEFLIGMKMEPEKTHKLLKMTTATTKNWLEAQADVLSEVEGVMVLDDVVGFLSKDDYLEFAHPYLKEIFAAFPNCVKMYHNDTDNSVPYEFLEELQVNIFNFTHLQNIAKVRELVGNKVCLLGNIPPLDVLTKGTPDLVREKARTCISEYGSKAGLILSAGGGTSPGTPGENIRALVNR
jgi:uroporphyrinogen decarboxylase